MKNENKVFVSVPITQEIIEKLEDHKYYFFIDKNTGGFKRGVYIKEFKSDISHILLEQPLPIGKTAEEVRVNFYGENDSRAYDKDEIFLMKEFISQAGYSEEDVKKSIEFGWNLSHYHRLETEENLLKKQKSFIQSLKHPPASSQLQPSQVEPERRCMVCGEFCEYCQHKGKVGGEK